MSGVSEEKSSDAGVDALLDEFELAVRDDYGGPVSDRFKKAHAALRTALASREPREPERLRAVIERGRSEVASGVHGVKAAVHAFGWLSEGRGSYEWDDDRYRKEFRRAMSAVLEAIKPLETLARDWTDCPTTQAGVEAARRVPLVIGAEPANE